MANNRDKLIALAYKYEGDYFKIVNAIKNNEDIEPIKNPENCITIYDDNYPKELIELKYPPFVLFYKGDLSLLNNEKAGVVGSRLACDYANDITKKLCTNLDKNNVTIVSGLAKGIDATAHRTCNNSIAVLGCGIDYIYPYENVDLYTKLTQNGLILSEYPNKTKPLSFHFPFRNRIIAGLSKDLYVMQSSEKSGTITTINEALELQKDVYVLPYRVTDEFGKYNNKLINDGAMCITEEMINEDYIKQNNIENVILDANDLTDISNEVMNKYQDYMNDLDISKGKEI